MGETPIQSPLIMYDPRSGTIYLEWRRGVVAYSVELESIVFDFNEDGTALGTECYLSKGGGSSPSSGASLLVEMSL